MLENELKTGRQAVLEAMRISRIVQKELAREDCITKKDKSPVTVADFTAQAIVCKILTEQFPDIPIVGEERSDALKKPENKETLDKIIHYIENDGKISEILNRDNLMLSIDLGGGDPTSQTFWTLDPVDGTKGFLRGEQFAIALALIDEGKVKLGILGCPNLTLPDQQANRGYLFFAVKNQGTQLFNVESSETRKVNCSSISDPKMMRFVESYESSHSNLDMQLQIARTLEMEREPVRLDSQVKYGIVASGNAEIYLRIPNPKTPGYREKIWDHAAGSLVVEEAGGVVTDIFGKKLDFSAGKTLKNNSGVFASVPYIHGRILEIIKELV
ncbi:MAG: 3'(2'),5'-bisphosphate nucleotidase [Candidatus Aminicenantes bacterium]|jgi:3'(2'), 5'-bisphosphate nucleotidase